jgi:hypothetical protein
MLTSELLDTAMAPLESTMLPTLICIEDDASVTLLVDEYTKLPPAISHCELVIANEAAPVMIKLPLLIDALDEPSSVILPVPPKLTLPPSIEKLLPCSTLTALESAKVTDPPVTRKFELSDTVNVLKSLNITDPPLTVVLDRAVTANFDVVLNVTLPPLMLPTESLDTSSELLLDPINEPSLMLSRLPALTASWLLILRSTLPPVTLSDEPVANVALDEPSNVAGPRRTSAVVWAALTIDEPDTDNEPPLTRIDEPDDVARVAAFCRVNAPLVMLTDDADAESCAVSDIIKLPPATAIELDCENDT